MATLISEQQDVIRVSKQELFDDMKSANPTEFGSKVFADVEAFEEDPSDNSYVCWKFNKVTV